MISTAYLRTYIAGDATNTEPYDQASNDSGFSPVSSGFGVRVIRGWPLWSGGGG